MRAGNLAKIATKAEILRIKHMLTRQGMRVAFGLVALVFLVAVLAIANVAIWQVVRMYLSPINATLVLLGGNLLLATTSSECSRHDPRQVRWSAKPSPSDNARLVRLGVHWP